MPVDLPYEFMDWRHWRLGERRQRRTHGSSDVDEFVGREHRLALNQVRGTGSSEGVLQLLGRIGLGDESAGWDVEQLQDSEELFGGEGSVTSLDLAEAALRET